MTEGQHGDLRRGALAPVRARWPWVTGGLALQLIGVGAPAAYVVNKAKHDNLGGSITRATVRLAWHQAVHSHAGLGLLIGGAIVFATGAVLLARPFAKSWLTLLVAVPIAALAGVLVLGAAALVVGLICVGISDLGSGGGGGSGGGQSSAGDWIDYPGGSSSSSRRRRRRSADAPPA